jgi:hypothetical protein
MRELSVHCDARTLNGGLCSKRAYEPVYAMEGTRYLCTIHRRKYETYRRVQSSLVDGWVTKPNETAA